jgi:pyruvate-formate lyase-activating enzyme|tara:strand:+ start:237 stop:476 length:240 start_codon:yes stop_codon:yes gene_type:complete
VSTQKEQVLAFVRTNGTITHRQADETYSITRLAAVIFDLKDEGHMFVEPTEIVKGKNKFGTPCTWAKYQYLGMKNKENR